VGDSMFVLPMHSS